MPPGGLRATISNYLMELTNYAELENNSMVNQQTIKNENHALIVRLEKAHLTVAGRCAG